MLEGSAGNSRRGGVRGIRETLLGIRGTRKLKKYYFIKYLTVALRNRNFIVHYLETLFQLHRL